MGKLNEILAYAGIEKHNFVRINPKIIASNRIILAIFSGVGTILSTITFILACTVESVATNVSVFSFGALSSLVIFILALTATKDNPWLVGPLIHITICVYFIYSIIISVFASPNQLAVMFMVMLVFLPTVFIIKPSHMLSLSAFNVALFIVSCFWNKEGAVLITDIIDAILFLILGNISGAAVGFFKLRGYSLECQLQDASRLDQLTQMNNRNSFEMDLPIYPSACKKYMGCVYIDVNGLHELNNSQGHAEGDKMLCFVANAIKEVFGKDYSYRVGGDEFIAFVVDSNDTNISAKVDTLRSIVESEGYHIATGHRIQRKSTLDIKQLVNEAESEMYMNKKEFYKTLERDSRSHIGN